MEVAAPRGDIFVSEVTGGVLFTATDVLAIDGGVARAAGAVRSPLVVAALPPPQAVVAAASATHTTTGASRRSLVVLM